MMGNMTEIIGIYKKYESLGIFNLVHFELYEFVGID